METNIFEQMIEATVELDEERCVALAQEALDRGVDPYEAIQEGYTKGMQIVGAKFAKLEIFLPEVMMAARAVNAAVAVLRPHLLERKDHGTQGSIVLGTIQGDLHDVGKNIVKIMLQASGFIVHDVGVDVPVRRFVEKAVEVDADIIAASAILTTTMTYMPDLVELLTELGLREKFRVMLGGAPVTRDWALKVGADGYGEDATEAVEVAKRLVEEKKGVEGA